MDHSNQLMRKVGLLAFVLLTGCASNPRADILMPIGQLLAEPASVQAMMPELAATTHMHVGDKLVAINGNSTPTFSAVLATGMPTANTVYTFENSDGATYTVPLSEAESTAGQFNFALMQPGDALVAKQPFNGNSEAPAGLIVTEFGAAMASIARWQSAPRLIEVEVSFQANVKCTSCTLKNFGLIDVSHNSLLSPIPIDQAAWIEYPSEGAPANFMAVPPPRPVGSTTTTTMTGTYSGTYQTFGNYGTYNGTMSGVGNSYTTYNYDYTATNMAAMYNLGVAIRNARIQTQNNARAQFINSRYGNLRLGALAPGETVAGHMFFAAPTGFDGPYALVVLGDSKVAAMIFRAN